MKKECFSCGIKMERALINNVEIDYCPKCLGLWFDEDELRLAKDGKDENLKWFDVDLWKNKLKLKVSRKEKLCPVDRLPLYEVDYDDSGIKVDVCNVCKGIWLDRGEFKKIIKYLQEKSDWEVLNNYYKNLGKEAVEIFIGPETVREEIEDFMVILKLFKYKFISQHPKISEIILGLPK
jgi:Zn-finger nucleic acid-binding protein